jgi:V/A-type H+-transporting ATPase subunit E
VSTNTFELEAQLIEKIVEKRKNIMTHAEEKTKKIMASAKEEVEKINAESERQVLSLVGSELRAVNDRIVGSAELEGRRLLMQTRQELLSKVFEEAERKLEEMAEGMKSDYTTILVKLISESASAIGGEVFFVTANERDLTYIKKNLKTINRDLKKDLGDITIKLEDDPVDITGGVVVRNDDATKTYYNTLKGKLDDVRSKIEAEVAQILGVI